MFSFFKRCRQGASVTEFGLMIGLIAIVLISSVSSVGQNLSDLFGMVNQSLAGKIAEDEPAETPPAPPVIGDIPAQINHGGAGSFSFVVSDTDSAPEDIGVMLSGSSDIITGLKWSGPEMIGGQASWTISYVGTYVEGSMDIYLRVRDETGVFGSQTVSVTITKPSVASCQEAYDLGWTSNGLYPVDLSGTETYVSTSCLMNAQGGGWTEIATLSGSQQTTLSQPVPTVAFDYTEVYLIATTAQYIDYDTVAGYWNGQGFAEDRIVFNFGTEENSTPYRMTSGAAYRDCGGSEAITGVVTHNNITMADPANCLSGNTPTNMCPLELIVTAPTGQKLVEVTDVETIYNCTASDNSAVWDSVVYVR